MAKHMRTSHYSLDKSEQAHIREQSKANMKLEFHWKST